MCVKKEFKYSVVFNCKYSLMLLFSIMIVAQSAAISYLVVVVNLVFMRLIIVLEIGVMVVLLASCLIFLVALVLLNDGRAIEGDTKLGEGRAVKLALAPHLLEGLNDLLLLAVGLATDGGP